jgi:hypothetical protein
MFTIRLLSIAANKQFECEPARFPYWIAPIKLEFMDSLTTDHNLFTSPPDKILAWDEVTLAAKERWQEPKMHDLTDSRARSECLVYTKGEEGRRYYLREVRKDLTPLSPPPDGSRESDDGKFARIIDWYLAYRPKLNVNLDQPIWEVTLITRLFNYVRKVSIEDPYFPEGTLSGDQINSSQIETTLLSHSFDVRFEYRQSQCAVHGSPLAFPLDSGRRFPHGTRIENPCRRRDIHPSPPRSHHHAIHSSRRRLRTS